MRTLSSFVFVVLVSTSLAAFAEPSKHIEDTKKVVESLPAKDQAAFNDFFRGQKEASHPELAPFAADVKRAVLTKDGVALERLPDKVTYVRNLARSENRPLADGKKFTAWILEKLGNAKPEFLGELMSERKNYFKMGFKGEKGEFSINFMNAAFGWVFIDINNDTWADLKADAERQAAFDKKSIAQEREYDEIVAPLMQKASKLAEKEPDQALAIYQSLLKDHPDAVCNSDEGGESCKPWIEASISKIKCLKTPQKQRHSESFDRLKNDVISKIREKKTSELEAILSCDSEYHTGFHSFPTPGGQLVAMLLKELEERKVPLNELGVFAQGTSKNVGFGPIMLMFAQSKGSSQWEWQGFGYYSLARYKALYEQTK